MNNVITIKYQTIYLFEPTELFKISINPLKDFIYFLKFRGKKGIIDFSYSWNEDSIHNKLSIKENFLLDSIPTSLIRDKENNLIEFFNTLTNPFLIDLIQKLGDLTIPVNLLNADQLKLTTIIKAILSKSEYVFLVEPEESLTNETINTLKECIRFEVDKFGRKFLLKPKNQDLWLDTATHFVIKDDTSSYIEKKNPLLEKDESIIQKPYFLKKVS